MPKPLGVLSPIKKTSSETSTFLFNRGITRKQLLQLIDITSKDPEVRGNTSDTARFADQKSLEKWLRKRGGRIIYTLIDRNGNLCGIIWFSKAKIPVTEKIIDFDHKNYGITFAIRIYSKARGLGMSSSFLTSAIKDILNQKWYLKYSRKGVWLQTSNNNLRAKKLYLNTGWIRVSKSDKNNKIVMIYPN